MYCFHGNRMPPDIKMLSRIEHPCVYNGAIGLDFLKISTEIHRSKSGQGAPKNTQRYGMWSPAYTVASIMIQLQGTVVLLLTSFRYISLLSPCIVFLAFLFDGTAETALQNLTDLSEYTERRRKWDSGVKFSVEQVSNIFPCSLMLCIPYIIIVQSL